MPEPSSRTTSILGVVQPPGARAGRVPPGKDWILRFSVRPWRVSGEAINLGELHVTFPVSDKELSRCIKIIASGAILEFVVDDPVPADHRVVMVRLLAHRDNDDDLNAAARRMLEPVQYDDPALGRFTLDNNVNWYQAEVRWGHQTVKLRLSMDEAEDISVPLALAKQVIADVDRWNQRVRAFAVTKLLSLKNATWLGAEEEPLSESEFLGNMTLVSVVVYPSGALNFFHSDGGLFWGHSIRVRATVEEGPVDADIPG